MDYHESVGHKVSPVHTAVLRDQMEAVRHILAALLVPDDGALIETYKGVEVAIFQRVAPHLDVGAEEPHTAYAGEEAELRGVLRHTGQGICYSYRISPGDGVCAGFHQGMRDGIRTRRSSGVQHRQGVGQGRQSLSEGVQSGLRRRRSLRRRSLSGIPA